MMNSKLKKICCGIVAGLGLLSLTGCNSVSSKLSDDQINNLLTIADNADKFMDETMDLLEGANEKIDLDQAYRVYERAILEFDLNVGGKRDNLILEQYQNGVLGGYVYYYKNANGQYHHINMDVNSQNVVTPTTAQYETIEDTSKKVYVRKDQGMGYEVNDYSEEYPSVDAYLMKNDELIGNTLSYGKENINSVEVLENGNYLISFCRNEVNLDTSANNVADMEITKVEISKDYNIIQVNTNIVYAYDYAGDGMFYNGGNAVVKLNYGMLNDDKIEDIINLFNS